MEWLHPGNELVGQATTVNENCALVMSGNTNLQWVRTEKHSLSLQFKGTIGSSKYNPRFRPFEDDVRTEPVFADDGEPQPEYDSLILRNPTFDTWCMTTALSDQANPANATYAKDVFARNTLALLGHPQLYYRWVNLYVNGLYWGAYLLTEKADTDTCKRRFGEGNYYVWKDGAGAVVGDGATISGSPCPATVWANLLAASAAVYTQANAAPPEDASTEYAAVETQMEVGSFIDYTLLHACLGNFDSLHNNGRVYREMPDGKFNWLAYDVEVGADAPALNRDCFSNWWPGGSRPSATSEARLLFDLSKHPKFAQRYGDRAWQICFMPTALQSRDEDGALAGDIPTDKAQARFQAAATEFDAIRLSESLRWGMGYRDVFSAAPRQTTGTPYAIGTNTTPNTGVFFAARRTILQTQLQNRGLLSSVPMPEVSLGANPNLWTLTAPTLADSETYYNAGGSPIEPDAAGTDTAGSLLAPGASVTLTAPFHLTVRVRSPLPNGTTDDTPFWSNLFDVQLPTHP